MSANPNLPSKINMTESHQSEDISADNEQVLRKLAWAIEASIGQFKLLSARCNHTGLRSRLVKRLQELISVPIHILELEESETTLYARIQAELHPEPPNALMVIDLETVGDLERLLISTNQVREEFQKNFQFPLVIWINDEVLKKLRYLAPDFESWSITTAFTIAPEELRNSLKQKAQQWLVNELKLTKKASLELKADLKSSREDLLNSERVLEPELAADLEVLLGAAEYRLNNKDTALKHYLKGWEFWRQTNNIERQAKLIHDITFCYYQRALKYRDTNHPDWQITRRYLQQCLEVFERSARPDLVANSFLNLGRVLRKLQEWEQWEPLARRALRLHEAENKPIEVAQDYGFLAEVALAKKRWTEAEDLACKALEILANLSKVVGELPDESVLSYSRSLYRFVLAQAQQELDQAPEATRNLERVMEEGSPEYDTYLYLDILLHLRNLYFEQKEYFKAFEIKLERQSIEQQYGLRAFVGASRIQPRKQAKLVGAQVESEETVAPEIKASGRQLDVERLIERIGRFDYKLIVIYGQSGVGKSSLVNGGLMPALKQTVIGTQEVVPVVMRVYTKWVEELGRLLTEALAKRTRGSKEAETQRGIATLDSETGILLALQQQSESRSLETVLIFDQFEEFFFVYPDPAQRRQFFKFLGDCLNIPSVKAILSLREDYLHYLLECNRLDKMDSIGNDILGKNVLYWLGNFSPADTKEIIARLTESSNFQLEPALIEQLTQDLADQLGEVRPIELQVVGAQLQTESITTLTEYRKLGTKKELVKRYLAEVVKDCGVENMQVADLVQLLLTDERGTRPLKTRAEIKRDLQRDLQALSATNSTVEASNLDLILQIFVKSGLVLLLPENPDERYQLVHDYLAVFIRQQQEPKLKELKELRAALERERKQKEAILKRALMGSIAAGAVFAVLAFVAVVSAMKSQDNEINALNASSETLLASNQDLDALIKSLMAGKKLQQTVWANAETRNQVLGTLQKSAYRVMERNRLERSGGVRNVIFSPDGKQLATRGEDGTARLWDLSGQQLAELKEHSGTVYNYNVIFSPDGKQLATAGEDGTARLWDLSGQQLAELKGHSGSVYNVIFSPDGKQLATRGEDGTARLWDLSGQQLAELKGHSGSVYNVIFSPDGKQLATRGEDGTARLWDLSGQQLAELKGHSGGVKNVIFSPDGKQLATAGEDGTARLWDLSGQQLAELKGHSGGVRNVIFSLDGKQLATRGEDGTARLWDLSGQQLAELKGHSGGVRNVIFSPDGKQLATRGEDGTARLWDLSGQQLAELKGHSGGVRNVIFSPDGKQLATAGEDGTARLWDLSGQQLAELKGHSGSAYNVIFSPDGKQLAIAGEDGTAKLWLIEGLDELLVRSCHWVRDYLKNNPEISDSNVCDGVDRDWVAEGKELARLGDVEGAVTKFQTAREQNPNLNFDPATEARHLAAKAQAEQANIFLAQLKFKRAIAAYTQAQKLDPELEISVDSRNALCWEGSLRGYAKEVMFACEKAVQLNPKDGSILDSRGLARALTGNAKGAIKDFQAFIAWSDNKEQKSQRQRWINALRTGKNPFTPEELKSLENQ